MLRLEKLERSLGLFFVDDGEWSSKGQTMLGGGFASLTGRLAVANSTGLPVSEMIVAAGRAQHDFWNATLLCHRLDWLALQACSGAIPDGLWRSYSQLDIEGFLVQVRSLLDHVAELVHAAAQQPGQVPQSFEDLRNFVSQEKKRGKVGEDLARLVAINETRWFAGLRALRDAAVHRGAMTHVFAGPDDGILFNLTTNASKAIIEAVPEVAFNKNVLNFRFYAASVLAEVICLLEDVAGVLHRRFLPLTPTATGRGVASGVGFPVALAWQKSLLEHARRQQASRSTSEESAATPSGSAQATDGDPGRLAGE